MPDPVVTAFAEVQLDKGLTSTLDYAVPPAFATIAQPGVRVRVPLRKQYHLGTIVQLKTHSKYENVRPIAEVLSQIPAVSPQLFALAQWMAEYYCCSMQKVLRLFFPPTIRKNMQAKQQLFLERTKSEEQIRTLCVQLRQTAPAQAKVLEIFLTHSKGILLSDLLEQTAGSRSSIAALEKQGILQSRKIDIERDPLADATYFLTHPKSLNSEQTVALAQIIASIDALSFAVHLLHGVTGSGKTEVYLQAIHRTLAIGKTVIFLVPEIALTSQTVERIRGRFQEKTTLIHHRLSDGEKRDAWHNIYHGHCRIVIGARSCVFAPTPHLGCIIVDEEHDSSYKQSDEAPCYHARDVAIMRAKLCGATAVLGSATPCLESYHNALSGKYQLLTLKERPAAALLPDIHIIDMRQEKQQNDRFGPFSPLLIDALKTHFARGEQSLLFLNRRGYHTLRLCTACGRVAICPHCDISLTFHKKSSLLRCHLCQYHIQPPPLECAHCHSREHLQYQGAGTEQIERSLHVLLPDVRTLRLDAETTRHKGSHQELLKQFRAGKADVLIGTQMIAKGLHFPSVTLVGILHADGGIHIPDFRASERVFQLLMQVAGRAGRSALPGKVLVQTWTPDHPSICYACTHDYIGFYHHECESRQFFAYPPFSRLVKISASGKAQNAVQHTLEMLRIQLCKILPPSFKLPIVTPCGHGKIQDAFRFQFLVKGPSSLIVSRALQDHGLLEDIPKTIRVLVDIDPLSTFF